MKAIIYKDSIAHFIPNWPEEPQRKDHLDMVSAKEEYEDLKKVTIESAIPIAPRYREEIRIVLCESPANPNQKGPNTYQWTPENLKHYPLPEGVEMETYKEMTDGWVPTYNNPDNNNFDEPSEIITLARIVEKLTTPEERHINKVNEGLKKIESALGVPAELTKENYKKEVSKGWYEIAHGVDAKVTEGSEKPMPIPSKDQEGSYPEPPEGSAEQQGIFLKGFYTKENLLSFIKDEFESLTPEPDQEEQNKIWNEIAAFFSDCNPNNFVISEHKLEHLLSFFTISRK